MRLKFIATFIITILIIVGGLWYEKKLRITQHLQERTKQIVLNYRSLYNEHKTIADIIYKTTIYTPEIIDLYARLPQSDSAKRDVLREELYDKLKERYSMLKHYDVKQLHFHLPDSISFLRFHRRGLYGDDLSGVRETINYVNTYKRPIDGFEEGRIYNGYRFVYPIFDYDNRFLGSVEISFSTMALNSQFINHYGQVSHFLISKDLVERKVFSKEQNNYIPSPLPGFYFERSVDEKVMGEARDYAHKKLSKTRSARLEKRIFKGKNFSIYNEYQSSITTFIPVKNPVTHKVAGCLLVHSTPYYILNKTKNFYAAVAGSILFLGLIFLFLYKITQSRKKLTKRNQTLQTLFQEVDSGIGLIDLNGRFIKVNKKFAQLLGYDKEALLDKSCQELLIKEQQTKFEKALRITRKKGLLSRMKNLYLHSSGDRLHFETSLKLLSSRDSFIIVINSIEKKLQLESLNEILEAKVKEQVRKIRIQDEIMLKQNRLAAMGEMIGSIAHQWRQPLNALDTNLEALLQEYRSGSIDEIFITDFIENNQKLIALMHQTIDDFRNFFKEDRQKSSFSVSKVIDNTLFVQATQLESYNITLELKGEDFRIYGYESEFLQVMLNLINNAKDAIVERRIPDGHITVEMKDDQVIISDNAKGISEDIINKIFDPYITTKAYGTGIGLYMVKQILAKIKARISVKNGLEGAIFTITFSKQ